MQAYVTERFFFLFLYNLKNAYLRNGKWFQVFTLSYTKNRRSVKTLSFTHKLHFTEWKLWKGSINIPQTKHLHHPRDTTMCN